MSIVDKRSELVFLYDIKDASPNGDPLDMNKPRVDEETGINIVTDVRLKRTIRDYLYEARKYDGTDGKDIFVREKELEDGTIQDGKTRAKDFKEESGKILESCIDVRLFGGVIPLSKDSITYTGPVQFQMGRSLHSVEVKHIKGTGAFASKLGSKNKTFREEYVLPYSLIGFYGIINENAAKHTGLSEDDVNLLLEGIWEGTKNLISRSKFGQVPRLLLKVNYSENNFYIGELKEYIKLKSGLMDEKIRDISDVTLDFTELVVVLNKYADKIDSVEYLINERVALSVDGKNVNLAELDKFKEIEF